MRVFFVTDRLDAHAERFSASFRAAFGGHYTRVSVSSSSGTPTFGIEGHTHTGWAELRAALGEHADVVVSGPLDTVSVHLVGGDYSHAGISWATDVMVSAAASAGALEALSATVAQLQCVVTDNYAAENALIALGAPPETICRIPWGPELPTTQAMTRADLGLAEDALVLLYPRSIEAHYQPQVFLTALEIVVTSHPNAVAVLVETGSQVDQLKESIAHKGLEAHVLWQPVRPAREFMGLIALADVVVVTTVTDGTSVTVLEAMAQEIPVVASLTNGSAEWVMDGITGWTFPVGDAKALAHALERAVSAEPRTRSLVTSNAKRLVTERAGWARSEGVVIDELQKLFRF